MMDADLPRGEGFNLKEEEEEYGQIYRCPL
jgi:hypothetical protein